MEKKILIIPDVHARDFWRGPVKETFEKDTTKIIFLGDYLDPYPEEWKGTDVDYQVKAVETLKEIIELKKQFPERITLLIGNHDCGYAINRDICSCRSDRVHYGEISKIFRENIQLFKLADEDTINNTHFIFSHAGISKEYAVYVFGEDDITENNVVNTFNEHWENQTYGVLDSLGVYDKYRGDCFGRNFASLVWADISEWVTGKEGYGYQVFGHTRLRVKSILGTNYACLDSQRAFYIDEEGKIREYGTDEEQKIFDFTK